MPAGGGNSEEGSAAPSEWIHRWRHLFAPGCEVLDLACGGGRHSRLLAEQGLRVTAVDKNPGIRASFSQFAGITAIVADLEQGRWPFDGRRFGGIVITNYLYRPILPAVLDLLTEEGVLVYETFMTGNEAYGSPRNPDFLLVPDELLNLAAGRLRVVAFEQGAVEAPRRAVVQRLCAVGMAYKDPLILR